MKIPQRAFVSVAVIYLAGLGHAQILREAPLTEVIVETTPRAEIFWDDRLLGTAPLNGTFLIHNAMPGEHALRVTLRDKDPFTRKVMVSAGKTITIRAELANQTGDLEVLTTPGAEIPINGKPAPRPGFAT